jgi:hypothetical protein
MRSISLLFAAGLAVGGVLAGWLGTRPAAAPDTGAAPSPGPLSQLRFERNAGQIDSAAPYFARGPGYTLYLESSAATLALRTAKGFDRVRMEVLGASPQAALGGERELAAKVNYLVGAPSRWRSGLPLYAAARVDGVYPGVDLVYYGRDGQLEYDFIVAPGADPAQIRLRFDGVRSARLDDDGALRLAAGDRELVQHAPVVYQENPDGRTDIEGRYVLDEQGTVAFQVAAYDATRPLVIDPILTYSTLLGGGGEDIAVDLAIDDGNHAYVVGLTTSADLPATEGAYDTTFGGDFWADAFVAKLHPGGTQLLYLTYLGGGGYDAANAVTVDALGQVYVAGAAELGGFPTTPGAYGAGNGTCSGGFVVKLSADGSTPLYSACLGTTSANAVALGNDGSLYVGGATSYGDYTTVQASVARLSADGADLLSLNTFGGSMGDGVAALAVDAIGNTYVVGNTADADTDFPATPGAFGQTHGGRNDVFVAKLDPAGEFIYATLLGGSDPDYGNSIAVDDDGNVYAGGWTGDGSGPSLGDFPVTPGAFRTVFEGQNDGFVAKIDATGSTLLWSTFISSDSAPEDDIAEEVYDLALAPRGFIYVVGLIGGHAPFPVTSGALDEAPSGGDGYLLVLSEDGSQAIYATYVGGGGIDDVYAVEVNNGGVAWLAGATAPSTTPFPTTPNAYDETHNNSVDEQYVKDAFVLRLRPIVNSAATFKASAIDVPSNATVATVGVQRGGDVGGEFVVDYVAEAGDQTLAQGTLTWADGESADQPIEFALPAPAGNEPPPEVEVTLSLPNGRIAGCKTATVTRGTSSGGAGACAASGGDGPGDGPGDGDDDGGASGGSFGAWALLLAVLMRFSPSRPRRPAR